MAVGAAVLLALAVVSAVQALPQTELSVPSKAPKSTGNEHSYIIDNEHVTNHSKLVHQEVHKIPDTSLLENVRTVEEFEEEETLDMESQVEREPAIRMLPRTTNRKLPFRRKDLRKQRRKKLRIQKTSKKQQEESHAHSDVKEADGEPNVTRSEDSNNVTNENKSLAAVQETGGHPTNVTNPDSLSASEEDITESGKKKNSVRSRLKLRKYNKSNSFRPTVSPPSTSTAKPEVTTPLDNQTQSNTTESPENGKSITRSSRGRRRFPSLDQEEIEEDRNPSPGGPRPPMGSRNIKRKARRRKKLRKLKENSAIGHVSDVFPSVSYPVYSTVQPKQFEPTFSDVAHVHSTGKPRRKFVSRKQIKRRPGGIKMKKDHVDKTSRQEIFGRSEISNNNNLAVSFQQTYTPRDFGSSQSSYQTPTPSIIPSIPINFNLPQIPNNSILPVSPHTPQPPTSNFALSSDPLPPPNRYNIQSNFRNPIRNYGFPSNPQPPPNSYGQHNIPSNFNPNPVATTPRGRFGSPPLGTPPPTFVVPRHPSDGGVSLNSGNSGQSSGASHGSFSSNKILPVPDKPFSPVVNVVPQSHPHHSPFRSGSFAHSRPALLSPNVRPQIHSIPRPPPNVPPPGQFTRNHVFSNNFRNTEISPVHSIRNNLFNSPSISSSPVAVSHQSRIFPGLESPQSHPGSNNRPPSFRGSTPRPFHEPSSPEGSFGTNIRSPSVRGGTPRPFNPHLSFQGTILPQISTAGPHRRPFGQSGLIQPFLSNSPRPSRPNQSPSRLRSPVSPSPLLFSTSSFSQNFPSPNHIRGTVGPFGIKETSGQQGTNTIIENINSFKNEIDFDDGPVVIHENSKRPQSNGVSSHFKTPFQINQNSHRTPPRESSNSPPPRQNSNSPPPRENSNPAPEPPSYQFEPPPATINTFRDSFVVTERPSASPVPSFPSPTQASFFQSPTQPPQFPSPTQPPNFPSPSFHFPTTPQTSAPSITKLPAFEPFRNTPLPPANIDFSSVRGNSLPVINTFHHLKLDSLQPPFESVGPEITSHNKFQAFSTPSTPKITSGISPEPLRTFFDSLFTTPQTVTEIHDSLFTTPEQISSTNKRHPLKPMNDFPTTSPQSFQPSVSFSQTTPKPFTEPRSVTTPFSATADWLAAFKKTNDNPITSKPFSESTIHGIPSFNRQVTHDLKIQNSFGTSITAQPFTNPTTRSFRPTTEHPVIQKMEQFHLKKQQFDQDETLTPLSPLSKPIQPHMTLERGRFRNLFQNSREKIKINSFRETDEQKGLRPLTSAEQTFRPINPPSHILRNNLGFNQQLDNKNIENTGSNNKMKNKFRTPNIESIQNTVDNGEEISQLHQAQNNNQNAFSQGSSGFIGISPSQFLSSPAPSAEFFNQRFRVQSLPTLPPSPHMPFTTSIDVGSLFTDQSPTFPTQAPPEEPLKLSINSAEHFFTELKDSNSIDEGHLFTDQSPTFPTQAPHEEPLKLSINSAEHFFTKLKDSNSIDEGHLFTDQSPTFPTQAAFEEPLKLSMNSAKKFFDGLRNSNSIDGENLFTAHVPVFTTNSPFRSPLSQSLNSEEQHFLNSNSLENPNTQEVIVLTSEENDPSSKIPQSLLDIIDFSKFKGRSFIFFRTNNHQYSVVFPMSEPGVGSSPEQFMEALGSEERPLISLTVNDFNQNTLFHQGDEAPFHNDIDDELMRNDISFHHPPSIFDDADLPSPPLDSTRHADSNVTPLNQRLQPPLLV